MVDQTYLPSKTVTLKDDKLNVASTESSAPKSNVPVKDNYLSHKTVILNAGLNEIKEEEIKPPSISSTIDSKVDEISQKAINIVKEIKIEKIEEKAKEVQSNISNAINTSPLNTDAVKGNYLSHKSVNLTTEVVAEKIEEKLKEEVSNKINILSPAPASIDSKDNYPSHKTIDLSGNAIKQEEKSVEPKISIDVKTIITKEEQTIVQTIATDTNNSMISEKVSEQKVEFVSKVDIAAEKVVNQVIDAPQTIGLKEDKNETYPSRKTVILKEDEKISLAVNDKKNLVDQVIVSTENKIESVTVLKSTETPSTTYPNHKTHYFVKEENKVVAENDGVSAAATSSSSPTIKKEEPILQVNNKPGTVVSSAKPKKPVLWIVISSSLFLVAAISIWFFYNQQNSLKEEITLLKINNESLTDSVLKLRRDKLQFDDIIIRGGKIDPKNNITLLENATDAEALRICFSINSNQYATIGKKAVYIRIIDPNNNVLVKTKDNLFDYKGNQIPFSLKKEVEYRKEEVMLCIDYKPEEKLQKGLYKAEIYNDGVLDLKGSFELK
ncbi:MAG: hypothetical protein Q8L90_00665 [Bacteroidota bacterium]|nr:hypothetical protein [Bacteroidota bacterium]